MAARLVAARGICSCGMWTLVAACRLLVVACMWDLVPRQGIEPGPPALGAWSLTQWTTREVPIITSLKALSPNIVTLGVRAST